MTAVGLCPGSGQPEISQRRLSGITCHICGKLLSPHGSRRLRNHFPQHPPTTTTIEKENPA